MAPTLGDVEDCAAYREHDGLCRIAAVELCQLLQRQALLRHHLAGDIKPVQVDSLRSASGPAIAAASDPSDATMEHSQNDHRPGKRYHEALSE